MHVTFRKVEDTEIAEVALLNGTVAAFLATDKEPESGKPWRERFGNEYGAFKRANEPKKPEPKVEAKPEVKPEPVNDTMPSQEQAARDAQNVDHGMGGMSGVIAGAGRADRE